MRKKTSMLLALLLLVAGIAILAYPTVSNYINQKNGSYAIQELQQQIGQAGDNEIAEQLRLAQEYNAELLKGNQPENYEEILNIAGGMMGYIRIPKIEVDLPIYHGISDEVLSKGIGHMPESAFPVGGDGNHTVLTGHTGLPTAELFTHLTELAEGDMFYICILNHTAAYQVDQITVVLPSEAQFPTEMEEDYCTLVTCTPYGVNSHRLLVRGRRVEIPEEEMAELQVQVPSKENNLSPWAPILIVVLALLLLGTMILINLRHRTKRRH